MTDIDTLEVATRGYMSATANHDITLSVATKGFVSGIIETIRRSTRRLARMPERYLVFPRFPQYRR